MGVRCLSTVRMVCAGVRAHHMCQTLCVHLWAVNSLCTEPHKSSNSVQKFPVFSSAHFYRCHSENQFPVDLWGFSSFIRKRVCVFHVAVIFSMCRYGLFIAVLWVQSNQNPVEPAIFRIFITWAFYALLLLLLPPLLLLHRHWCSSYSAHTYTHARNRIVSSHAIHGQRLQI